MNASSNSMGLLGYATAADIALRLIHKAVADACKKGRK